MRNLAAVLLLKTKLSGKFQRFNSFDGSFEIALTEVSKCWKIVAFSKISIKMKNVKIFYETQTANHLKKIIQPPTR